MSFAGHVFDMINRVKYNESLKKMHRDRYARIKELYTDDLSALKKFEVHEDKIAPEEIKKIKLKIKKQIAKENKNTVIKAFVFTVLLILSVFLS